jgi:hypothetical protein
MTDYCNQEENDELIILAEKYGNYLYQDGRYSQAERYIGK